MSTEDPRERRAAEAVGRALGRALRRYDTEPGGDDSLDYIDDENEAYEMKSVTPQEYEELRAQRSPWHGFRQLAMHWSILLLAPTMDDKFRPMPDFPDDDTGTIVAIEADGFFTVTRKEARSRMEKAVLRRSRSHRKDRQARGQAPRAAPTRPRAGRYFRYARRGRTDGRGAQGARRGSPSDPWRDLHGSSRSARWRRDQVQGRLGLYARGRSQRPCLPHPGLARLPVGSQPRPLASAVTIRAQARSSDLRVFRARVLERG